MNNFIELIRIVRSSTLLAPDHTVLLETLSDAATVWRQTGSLAAYQVIVSALDSNDDEIRRWAEETLNRHSPRPVRRAS
jgi:hypothetical protein